MDNPNHTQHITHITKHSKKVPGGRMEIAHLHQRKMFAHDCQKNKPDHKVYAASNAYVEAPYYASKPVSSYASSAAAAPSYKNYKSDSSAYLNTEGAYNEQDLNNLWQEDNSYEDNNYKNSYIVNPYGYAPTTYSAVSKNNYNKYNRNYAKNSYDPIYSYASSSKYGKTDYASNDPKYSSSSAGSVAAATVGNYGVAAGNYITKTSTDYSSSLKRNAYVADYDYFKDYLAQNDYAHYGSSEY